LGDLPRHPRSLSLQSEFSDYYPYAAARRDREFRANAEKDYVEKVNRNPLLLFLANSNPTDQELLAATSQVASLARARKERLLEIRLSARNDSDLAPFTRIKAALPYTRARARALGLDPKSFEPNFADWLEEMTDHEFNNMLREAGVALGLTAACFAPWGRAVGAVAGRIVRAGCLTGVGLPLNTYFLWDAWDNYHEALLLALSAIEPGQQFSNFQRVESERSKINFFALLLPVGLNLKSAREAASALRALLFH
jgi:hypothetical protein